MRIGLNLLYLIPGEVGGVETYASELIRALTAAEADNEYLVYTSRSARSLELPESKRLQRIEVPFDAHNRYARYAWEQLALPLQAARMRVDVLHSLNYVGPVFCPTASVITVHDANYLVLRTDMRPARRFGLGTVSKASARRCSRVITVSEFSARELSQRLNIDRSRIQVIPSGPGNHPRPCEPDWLQTTGRRYGLDRPYVIAFGGGYKHKNIPNLIKSFEAAFQDLPHDLLIIGNLAEDAKKFLDCPGPHPGRVRPLGWIPQQDIHPLLSNSDLFVFPSLYEGFGFPALEAQSAGAVIACSNAAALPEVAGRGAEYFDPNSVSEMATVMRRCATDEPTRSRLKDGARENLARYSWRSTAASHLDAYRQASQESRGLSRMAQTTAGRSTRHRSSPEA